MPKYGYPVGDFEAVDPCTGETIILNYGRRTYFPPPEDPNLPPPTVVEVDMKDYIYNWKDEDRERYLAQVKESDGFDVGPQYTRYAVSSLITPVNPLGSYKTEVEEMARMAVDEYNLRDLGLKLEFSKIIKVMIKAVNGIRYYLTVEAIPFSSESPVTFQAVAFAGVGGNKVQSFRFISTDSSKHPWLWVEHLCACCHSVGEGKVAGR